MYCIILENILKNSKQLKKFYVHKNKEKLLLKEVINGQFN